MKQFAAVALFLCIYTTLWSQITITKNDMPSSLDTARYSTSNTRLKFDTTGAGITWDYSALATTGQNVDSFLPAFLINPAYVLSFGILDYGSRSSNLTTGLIALSNVYSFYKKTSSYLQITGFGGEYNNIPLAFVYNIPDKVYQFPLTYGRKDTTPYDLKITIPGVGTIHQVGKRYNEVDGWGTVITPYDTFSCLRLRAYTSEVDSFTITAIGTTIPFPKTTLTYEWLAHGQKIPVLEVAGTSIGGRFTPSSEKFRDHSRAIPPQFSLTVDFRASRTVCTTADTISITNRTRPGVRNSKYKYTITPATYVYAGGTNDSIASPKVNFTSPGLYTISLHVESPAGGSTPAVGDAAKVDYVLVSYPTGVADVAADHALIVYPNPASDMLNIRAEETITEIALMNARGQKVLEQSVKARSLSIDVRGYGEGIYLLDIQTANGHEVRKVVIQ